MFYYHILQKRKLQLRKAKPLDLGAAKMKTQAA